MRTLSLAAALLAAACFGLGSVLQKAAADRETATAGLELSLVVRLLRQWRYLLGWGFDLMGWGLQIVALRVLPLFAVQAFVAMNVGFTALFARAMLGDRLPRRGLPALALLAVSAVLLAISAPTDQPVRLSLVGFGAVGAGLLVVLAIGVGAARRAAPARSAAALGGLAGVGFGMVAVMSKAVAPAAGQGTVAAVAAALTSPAAYLLAAAGVLATLLYATGLQRGSVVAVDAPLVAAELILPTVLGLFLLGEPLPAGLALVATAAGFLGAATGALVLSGGSR